VVSSYCTCIRLPLAAVVAYLTQDVSLGIWNDLEIKEQAVCLAYVVYGSDITLHWLALANQLFVAASV